ncbi:MAG: L-threonylcarbamoyladenylate synthase, partial [Armatimonadota bacterium]
MSAARVIRVDEAGVEAAAQQAADALADGGLVVMPTDTVYGLAASLGHPCAIEAIFCAKNRPADMPLPVLVASVAEAEALVPGQLEAHEDLLMLEVLNIPCIG